MTKDELLEFLQGVPGNAKIWIRQYDEYGIICDEAKIVIKDLKMLNVFIE